jgi:transposase
MHSEPETRLQDAEELSSLVQRLQLKVEQQSQFINQLLEQIRLARHQHFGARSERFSLDQLSLAFNEAEAAAAELNIEISAADSDTVVVPEHRRKKGGRRRLPKNLPRVEVIYTLDERDCRCDKCEAALHAVSEKVSEQLDIVPARVQVIRHIKKTYACEACDGSMKTAVMPAQPIPKSLASPGTLAHIATAKYVDGLPLYRQEKTLARIGVALPRSTLASWMVKTGSLVQPLINLLRDRLLAYDIINMDETRLQVLKEAGKSAQSQSYLWVQRGGPPDHPILLYDYDPSRSQQVPMRLLQGFKGYLQTDGYAGYAKVCAENDLIALGCWAHVRRKFDEARKAQPATNSTKKKSLAAVALAKIQALYRIERDIKTLPPAERLRIRALRSNPLLDDLRLWLDQKIPLVPPTSALGKAMNYAHKQWPKLIVYAEDGRLRMDNNLVENAIRPFVIGRKNFLFCDSVAGANASANLYSLIETAKANGIEPYAYLKTVFTELPKATTVEQIEALLPVPADDVSLANAS